MSKSGANLINSGTIPSSFSKDISATALNRLPVEILSCIFCHLSSSASPDEKDLHAAVPPWCPVLHVCRWWRQVALETKDLWRTIPLGHIEWAKMVLQLSHPRSISITFPQALAQTSRQRLLDIAAVALVEARRAQTIHLLLGAQNEQIHRSNLLEALKRISPDELVDFRLKGDMSLILIHNELFHSQPAKLRRLHLERCVLDVAHNIRLLPVQLTTLCLVGCALHTSYSLPKLVDEIRLLLSLQSLEIERTMLINMDESDTIVNTSRPRVLLPHLKFYSIEGDYEVIHTIFGNIDAPLTCRFELVGSSILEEEDSPSLLQDAVDALAQLLNSRLRPILNMPGIKLDVLLMDATECRGSLKLVAYDQAGAHFDTMACNLRWGADPAYLGLDLPDAPTLSSVLGAIPCDAAFPTVCIGVVLDADEWRALSALLNRAEEISFQSSSYLSGFYLAHRQLDDEEMPYLKNITIFWQICAPGDEQEAESFSLVQDVIRNYSRRTGFKVIIRPGDILPTAEEQATLKSYGEGVRITGAW